MFNVAAKPLEFANGVLSGTIGGLEVLALAKVVMIAIIKPKRASRTPRFDIVNDFNLCKIICHRHFSGPFCSNRNAISEEWINNQITLLVACCCKTSRRTTRWRKDLPSKSTRPVVVMDSEAAAYAAETISAERTCQ